MIVVQILSNTGLVFFVFYSSQMKNSEKKLSKRPDLLRGKKRPLVKMRFLTQYKYKLVKPRKKEAVENIKGASFKKKRIHIEEGSTSTFTSHTISKVVFAGSFLA